jgi:hypothetical protein
VVVSIVVVRRKRVVVVSRKRVVAVSRKSRKNAARRPFCRSPL